MTIIIFKYIPTLKLGKKYNITTFTISFYLNLLILLKWHSQKVDLEASNSYYSVLSVYLETIFLGIFTLPL